MARLLWVVAAILFSAAAVADGSLYRGVIDGRINVLIAVEGTASESEGTVVYDATGGDGLRLRGTTDAQGRFEWREVLESYAGGAPRTQHTGTFKGTLTADRSAGDGTWASADGKRTRPFTLTRVGQSRVIRADDVDASVTYPQFDGGHYAALNAHLAATARDWLAEHARSVREARDDVVADLDAEFFRGFTQSTRCGVESVSTELTSLLCAVHDYSGGAHGNTNFFAENFVLRADGSFRKAGLWDALKKSPEATKRLSDLILEQLRRKDASLVLSGAITDLSRELAADAIPVTLIPAGLAFQFAPYAVASYAEGSFRVVVPNRAIARLVRTDGPLAERATVK